MLKKMIISTIICSSFSFANNGSIEIALVKSTLDYAESNRIEGSDFIADGKSKSNDITGVDLKFSFAMPSFDIKYENYGFIDIIYNSRKGDSSFNQITKSVDNTSMDQEVSSLAFFWIPDREYGLLFNSSFIFGLEYFNWKRDVVDSTSNFEHKDVTLYNVAAGYEGEYEVANNFFLNFRGVYKMAVLSEVDVDIKQNNVSESLKLGTSSAYDLSLGAKYYVSNNVFVKVNYTISDMDIGNSDIENGYQESKTSLKENKFKLGVGLVF